jgi:hypothetical protein
VTPEKIYLAAAYQRIDEMRGVRDVLEALGYQVTSRWIDQQGKGEGLGASDLAENPERGIQYAELDLEDLHAAETVISFTGQSGRGGRHVEFGVATALGKRLIVVGPREHVFHTLPAVEWFPDWSRLVMALSGSRACLR